MVKTNKRNATKIEWRHAKPGPDGRPEDLFCAWCGYQFSANDWVAVVNQRQKFCSRQCIADCLVTPIAQDYGLDWVHGLLPWSPQGSKPE